MVDAPFLEVFNKVASRSELVRSNLPEGTKLLVTLLVDTDESLDAACARLGLDLDIPCTSAQIINVWNVTQADYNKFREDTRLIVVAERNIYTKFRGIPEQDLGGALADSLKISARFLGCTRGDLFFLA